MKLNSKLPAYIWCFLLIFSTSCSHSEEIPLSILQSEPIFSLDIEAVNISFFVNVNGASAYSEYEHSGQTTLTVPINQWMHPKNNTLGILVAPPKPGGPFKPNSKVTVDLKVHENGNKTKSYPIASLTFDQQGLENGTPNIDSSSSGRYSSVAGFELDPEGDVEVGSINSSAKEGYEGALIFERDVIIPNALPEWAFFSSDELPDYFAIPDEEYYPERDSLFKEYEKVQKALESGSTDDIVPMFSERNQEVDRAYYLEPGTTEALIRESLANSASNDNLELVVLTNEHVEIIPEENKRIVSLRRANMKAAIALNVVDGEGAERYPMFFRRENGEWILTR